MQEDEKGERHPIVYLSKKLLPREQHYAAIEKECLAMVWALKKLEPYLFGRHFTVYTDHSPLTWLHQMKGANAKLLRWSLLLQDYDMDVVHVKGSANLIADALSLTLPRFGTMGTLSWVPPEPASLQLLVSQWGGTKVLSVWLVWCLSSEGPPALGCDCPALSNLS
ncbi:unnamed protein product [Natator depressus]